MPPPAPRLRSAALPARRVGALAVACLVVLGSGCAAEDPPSELLVSAAASLTDVLEETAAAFEAAHPGVTVTLNTGGSSSLAIQIVEGAPADVFAAADETSMARVADAGRLADEPRVFAFNTLRIAVPRGNPGEVTGLDDLAREDLLVGLCAEEVPCGALARRALAAAGVEPAVDTREPHVRALLTRLALGELDAGLVYATDVRAADGDVEGIALPAGSAVTAAYPVAVLRAASSPQAARAFIDFLVSPAGREILHKHGFGVPGGTS